MNKTSKLFAALGATGLWLAASAFGQTVIPFDTAQQYTNNFNEVRDINSGTNGNSMYWQSGMITIGSSTNGGSVGVALYNPNASATSNGPTYTTSTVEMDVSNRTFTRDAIQIGIVARVQTDGSAVYASYLPGSSGCVISVTYGADYGLTNNFLYTKNLGNTFLPTHLSLAQFQVNGVPTLYFSGYDNNGQAFNTGLLSLTGTNAYSTPGEVGFEMVTPPFAATGVGLDNFSFSPTVPEPGTLALCGVLVAGGAWLRRRNNV